MLLENTRFLFLNVSFVYKKADNTDNQSASLDY